jgi:hypothetical protein
MSVRAYGGLRFFERRNQARACLSAALASDVTMARFAHYQFLTRGIGNRSSIEQLQDLRACAG